MCTKHKGEQGIARNWKGICCHPNEKVHSQSMLAHLRASLVILLKEMDSGHCALGIIRLEEVLFSLPSTSFPTPCLCPLCAKEPDLVSENKFVGNLELRLPLHLEGLDYQNLNGSMKGMDKSDLLG